MLYKCLTFCIGLILYHSILYNIYKYLKMILSIILYLLFLFIRQTADNSYDKQNNFQYRTLNIN